MYQVNLYRLGLWLAEVCFEIMGFTFLVDKLYESKIFAFESKGNTEITDCLGIYTLSSFLLFIRVFLPPFYSLCCPHLPALFLFIILFQISGLKKKKIEQF
jgi:hypothetical protein